MVLRYLGDKRHKLMISSKTVNFNAEVLNLVIFFNLVNFFCESSDFCKKACGSTGQDCLVIAVCDFGQRNR